MHFDLLSSMALQEPKSDSRVIKYETGNTKAEMGRHVTTVYPGAGVNS